MLKRSFPEADEGFTLIEMVIGVVLLGLVVVGIIGGITTAITTSSVHRRQATAQTILISAAESVKSQAYQPCPTPAYNPTMNVNLYGAPNAPWNVQVVSVSYWDGATWSASCSTFALQKIELRVFENGIARLEQTVGVVKRPPS